MSAPHTPAPWMVEPINNGEFFHITTHEDHDFTVIAETPFGSNEADARLIATAPEMLDALQDAEEFIESVDPTSFTLAFVREVIAKATGASA